MRFRHVPKNGIFTVDGIKFLKTDDNSAVSENGNDIPFQSHKIVCYIQQYEIQNVVAPSKPINRCDGTETFVVAVSYLENGILKTWNGIATNNEIEKRLAEIRQNGKVTKSMFKPIDKKRVAQIRAVVSVE